MTLVGLDNVRSRGNSLARAVVFLSAAATVLFLACAAAAEENASPPQDSGLFGSVARWFNDTFGGVGSDLKSMTGKVGDLGSRATGAARDAVDTVARLPGTTVLTVRQHCERAPNGAPDCQAAADAVCRAKGLNGGRSLDMQTAEKCPADVWLSMREAKPGECTTESYVIRVVCQ